MDDLIAFLGMMLDDEEGEAREALERTPDQSPHDRRTDGHRADPSASVAYSAVDARTCAVRGRGKRQLLHAHSRDHECISFLDHGKQSAVDGKPWEYWEPKDTAEHGSCLVLRCLALPYSDREAFGEERCP
ncbi:DUF6221 family protein [Nonomuraea sp. NPDC001831]|uniref:DUF6221 family protein n=1 Tax=Nonomuraea sp. NPDC001831 TaxID=3364340 RepID=UPI00367E7191